VFFLFCFDFFFYSQKAPNQEHIVLKC